MTLREQLIEMAEPRYREFISPLMPGVEHVLGIRLPQLRRIAREMVRGDWRHHLAHCEDLYFEERMLRGLCIGYARCDPTERLDLIRRFVPQIDNWSVCDSFCMRRIPAAERAPMWEFIRPYFRSEAEYDVRFAVVTALSNYVDAEHLGELFRHLEEARHEGYYARMGVAWAVSVCFAKFPERTLEWLRNAPLEEWTYRKSLQKIVESHRVDAAMKQTVRALKRR